MRSQLSRFYTMDANPRSRACLLKMWDFSSCNQTCCPFWVIVFYFVFIPRSWAPPSCTPSIAGCPCTPHPETHSCCLLPIQLVTMDGQRAGRLPVILSHLTNTRPGRPGSLLEHCWTRERGHQMDGKIIGHILQQWIPILMSQQMSGCSILRCLWEAQFWII